MDVLVEVGVVGEGLYFEYVEDDEILVLWYVLVF